MGAIKFPINGLIQPLEMNLMGLTALRSYKENKEKVRLTNTSKYCLILSVFTCN